MNQTICCSSKAEMTVFLMNYKDEERQLSESLYRNLHVMMRFHEPSKEFLKIFDPHMFIKSNAKAFLFVMHFIFNCLDAAEFKRRFRWPIVDKTGETQFRKTTVAYMNDLNVAHQLGMETLRLSNIYIPGGLRFIKIIHRFTSFIMKEEIKKCGTFPNLNEIPDANEQIAKLETLVNEGVEFATRIEAQSDILSNQIDEMNGIIKSFFENCDDIEPENKQCWTCLTMKWREKLDGVMNDEIKPCLERVNEFGKQSDQLNERLTELFVAQKDNLVQHDREKLTVARDNVRKSNPTLKNAVNGILENNFFNFENLLSVFDFLLPKIMEKIQTFTFRNFDVLQFEYAEIETLHKNSSIVQDKISDIEVSLEPFLKKDEANFNQFRMKNQNLPFRVMHTPLMNRQSDPNRISHRLASINGKFRPAKLFKEPLHPMIRSVKKVNASNRSISVGQSSSHQLTSMNASLHILSRKKPSNATFGVGATSTPIPSTDTPIERIGNNPQIHQFPIFSLTPMPTTKAKNLVDRVVHSNRLVHIRSPSRRFQLIDADNVVTSTNLFDTMNSNGYECNTTRGVDYTKPLR